MVACLRVVSDGGSSYLPDDHGDLLRLSQWLADALKFAMATIDAQVEANLEPFRTAVEQIISIPVFRNLGAHLVVSYQR